MCISWLSVGSLGNIMLLLTDALHCLHITFSVKYALDFSWIKQQEKLNLVTEGKELIRQPTRYIYLKMRCLVKYLCKISSVLFLLVIISSLEKFSITVSSSSLMFPLFLCSFLAQSQRVWNIRLQRHILQYNVVCLLSKRVICPQIPKSLPLKLMRIWLRFLLPGPVFLNTHSKNLSWIQVQLIHPTQIWCSPVPLPLCHNTANLQVIIKQL